MEIEHMRLIDKYIGIATCFALSQINHVVRIFSKPKFNDKPKKILLLKISEMAGAVFIYPSVKEIKRQFPNAEIYFMAFSQSREIIELLKITTPDKIITLRHEKSYKFLFDTLKTIIKIRKLKIDTTIDFEFFSRYTNIVSYLSGAKRRIGFYRFYSEGLYRGDLLTHNLIYNYYLHTSKSYFLLARALSKIPQGTKPTPLIHEDVDNIKITLPKIESSDASKKRILSRIADENPKMRRYINKDRIILIAPNSSQMLILRKWPIENYIGLIRQILKNHRDVLVVLTGSSSDVQEASMIESSVGEERCINFTGRTTMKELIDLYNVSDVLVTHDGGPAHFASLTEIKTITLFGTETPLLWGPIGKNNISITANLACSPCINIFNQRKSPCTNNYCLQAIKVDKVYDIVDELLNEKKIHESKGSIKELIKIKTRI